MTTTERPALRILVRHTDGSELPAVLDGGRDRHVVGRRDAGGAISDLTLDDRHVSRRHCAFAWDPALGAWTVTDLKSANGTRLNGTPVDEAPLPVRSGDRINLGATLLILNTGAPQEDAGDADRTVTVHQPISPSAPRRPAADPDDDATLLGDGGGATVLIRPDAAATVMGHPPTLLRAAQTPAATPSPAPSPGPHPTPTPTPAPAAADPTALADLGGPADDGWTAGFTAAPAPSFPPPVAEERRAFERPEGEIVLNGIARDLVQANLLDGQKAVALCKVARDTGRTFFRMLAEDTSVRFHDEIYALVGRHFGLEALATEKELMEQAVATGWLPFPLAAKRGAVVLASGDGRMLRYATIDPFDLPLDDWVARCAGKPTQRLLVTPAVFQSALQRLKNQGEDEDGSSSVLVIDIPPEVEQRIATRIEEADVPQLVNYFLQRACLQGASDIHIEPTEDYLLVRNRVDGILHEDTSMPVSMHPEISSRIKIVAGMDVAEKRRPQDGRISSVIQGNPIDVRVSSYPTIYGEKMVLRLLDKNALRPSPEHLGMVSRDLRLLYDKLGAPYGLVMICGPTGSGKTTTLYSCLGSIDKKAKNVLTVEDPVEYRLKGVHQMQVNDRIGLTFASGLRTILRQDPDVIMVGECRDTETSAMAIQAALTGHIVFSTIHTNDAVGVVTRLLDMGIDHFLVANALTLTIAQRLVRKVCGHCQTMVTGTELRRQLRGDGISAERLEALGIEIDDDLTYVQGLGCVHCRNTGYSGRQAAFEVFEMTNAARNMILSPNFNADELRRMARESGMTTLIGHGLQLIEEGITTHAEVIRVLGETY